MCAGVFSFFTPPPQFFYLFFTPHFLLFPRFEIRSMSHLLPNLDAFEVVFAVLAVDLYYDLGVWI